MERVTVLENLMKLPTSTQDLEIYATDLGEFKKVWIKGNHVMLGGSCNRSYSEFKAQLSLETLSKIVLRKGRFFRDEVERSENPNYLQRKIEILLKEFGISLSGKRMLDFGCGAGASTLIFLRCGANSITGLMNAFRYLSFQAEGFFRRRLSIDKNRLYRWSISLALFKRGI